MSTKNKFLQLAANAAMNSTMLYQMGACITVGGKPIVTGYNSERSSINLDVRNTDIDRNMRSSCGKYSCVSTHAEIASLSKYLKQREKCGLQEQESQDRDVRCAIGCR